MTAADLSAVKFYWVTRGNIVLVDSPCGATWQTLLSLAPDTLPRWIRDLCSFRRTYERLGLEQNFEVGKEFGVVPCGLGARNTLRLEGSLSLYGHEISDTLMLGGWSRPLLQDG